MEIGVKQAADLLNVSDKTIYRWLADERIPFYRVGAQYRFSREELLRWTSGNRSGAFPAQAVDTAEALVSLEESLRTGGIFYRVGGRTVRAVLEEMLSLMRLPAEADENHILELVYERERMASTGIGEGIALPHCRDLMVAGLVHPMVALGFLEQPVDFKAIDKKPVTTVFLFLSPSSPSSIRIMSRLAYASRHIEFAEAIKEVAGRETILAAAVSVDRELDRE